LQADARRQDLVVDVRSWLPIEALVERHAETWLDRMDTEILDGAVGPLADELRKSLHVRKAWLQNEGYAQTEDKGISPRTARQLRQLELRDVVSRQEARLKQSHEYSGSDTVFRGLIDCFIDTAQGRFVLVKSPNGFAISRWSADFDLRPGRDLTLRPGPVGETWLPAVGRSLQR